jgi:hypothetical protein
MEAVSSDQETVLGLQVKVDLVLGKGVVKNALSGRMGKFFGWVFFLREKIRWNFGNR